MVQALCGLRFVGPSVDAAGDLLTRLVAEARDARIELSDSLRRNDSGSESEGVLEAAEERDRLADLGLSQFRESVDHVCEFLARAGVHIFRTDLEPTDVYEIFGRDVEPLADALRLRLQVPLDVLSGCPGPFHAETEEWRTREPGELIDRILWTTRLISKPMQHRRVLTVLDLLEAEAVLVGDINAPDIPVLADDPTVGSREARSRLWRVGEPFSRRRVRRLDGRLVRAARESHRLFARRVPLEIRAPSALTSRAVRRADPDSGRYQPVG
jgi:hypothetical protein